jgi:hypothetical protein
VIGLGLEGAVLLDHGAQVGHGATCGGLGEGPTDGSVEAHPAGAEEGTSVELAAVDGDTATADELLDDLIALHREAERACQAIARAFRYDAESRLAPDEAACDLIDRAITSDGYDVVVAFADGTSGKLFGVPSGLGVGEEEFVLRCVVGLA